MEINILTNFFYKKKIYKLIRRIAPRLAIKCEYHPEIIYNYFEEYPRVYLGARDSSSPGYINIDENKQYKKYLDLVSAYDHLPFYDETVAYVEARIYEKKSDLEIESINKELHRILIPGGRVNLKFLAEQESKEKLNKAGFEKIVLELDSQSANQNKKFVQLIASKRKFIKQISQDKDKINNCSFYLSENEQEIIFKGKDVLIIGGGPEPSGAAQARRVENIKIINSSIRFEAIDHSFDSVCAINIIQDLTPSQLDHFFTWQAVRDKIYTSANVQPVVVTELEPFYAKWPENERLTFLKNLLRSSPTHGIVIIINCLEDLSELKEIEKNSRGLIWAPSK